MSKVMTDVSGKEGLMVTVEYPPGGSDPVHRHNAHAFLFVLEGSVVMQVKGGKQVTLTPGQTFYEDSQRCSYRWPEREQNPAGKIRCVLGQGQGRSGASASEVRGGPVEAQGREANSQA